MTSLSRRLRRLEATTAGLNQLARAREFEEFSQLRETTFARLASTWANHWTEK